MDGSSPIRPQQPSKRGCLKVFLLLGLSILAGIFFLFFVLVPLFQPAPDDSIQGPVIEKRQASANKKGTNQRGSMTDYLIDHPILCRKTSARSRTENRTQRIGTRARKYR